MKVFKIIAALSVIGLMSGGILSQLSNWASPLIEANRKAETERAIFLVQPGGKSYEMINVPGVELFKVFDENSASIGYAMVYNGNGYGGNIRIMAGISDDLKEVIAIEVLELAETPGLGTKITEEPFTTQFEGLSAFPSIELVKGAPPAKPNEVQSITGATISAKAVVDIINNGLRIVRNSISEGSR